MEHGLNWFQLLCLGSYIRKCLSDKERMWDVVASYLKKSNITSGLYNQQNEVVQKTAEI